MTAQQTSSGDGAKAPSGQNFSVTGHMLFAALVVGFLIFGVGGWAATSQLAGAVMAPGTFVVERNVKKVQHSTGGVVAEINVRNGDRVSEGQVLLRLDATQTRAELGIIQSQMIEITARGARLAAERDGLDKLEFPKGFIEQSSDAAAAAKGEVRLFEENRRTKESQKSQLLLRIEQSKDEIKGLTAQRQAKLGEHKLIKQELAQLHELYAKKLTPITRVYAMEREEQRLGGELGGLAAQIARVQGQISEVSVQIMAVDETVRATAQKDQRASEAKLVELAEREVAAKDKLSRIDLRAPRSGVVLDLAAHTVGGVVSAAEQIMLIVPDGEPLTIQARIAPADRDKVSVGRPARFRLSAFNQQTTPEVFGRVVDVAADVTLDAKTGQSHYVVRLEMDEKAQKVVGDLRLVAGMPVEVFVSTGDRTVMSYLTKPFRDQMEKAFRE
jgi:HlyD family secretion protein